MTEKLFDSPSHPIKRQGLSSAKTIAHHIEVAVPTAFALDHFIGE